MELEELLVPLAGEFDVDEALESWRWLVPQRVRALAMTPFGDLFLIGESGAVLFLDTIAGKCTEVAASAAEWEEKLRDPKLLDQWFMPGFLAQLRDVGKCLFRGECYDATIPPILSGAYSVENWTPTHWRVHFHSLGQIHEQVKDLPEGTPITKVSYTELPTDDRTSGRRTVGHYLLLVLAVVFWLEMVLFLASAFHAAGRDDVATMRWGILTIGVFVSGAVAAHGFARRVRLAWAVVLAVLLAQPVVNALLPSRTAGTIAAGVICGIVVAVLAWAVIRENR